MVEVPTIGGLIDDLQRIRLKVKELNAQISELEAVKAAKESDLLILMETQHTTQGRGILASASKKVEVVAQADDWDKLYPFIARNKAWHLLQRRLNNAAFREMLEQRNGKPIPGLVPFNKVSISLHSLG